MKREKPFATCHFVDTRHVAVFLFVFSRSDKSFAQADAHYARGGTAVLENKVENFD
jgi:hypothetical protein